MKRNRVMTLVAVLLGMAVLGAPAMALEVPITPNEGQRTSYISGARTGFTSHSWWDGNIDDWSTDITFENCTEVYRPTMVVNATIELRYERSLLPDVSKGERLMECYKRFYTGHWGRMSDVGYYHFRLNRINGKTYDEVRYWLDVYRVYFSW